MLFSHQSVLLREAVDGLRVRPDGIYVDGTIGGGGHSLEICRRLSPEGKLIGFDQDGDAVQAARARLEEFGDRVTILRSNYSEMSPVLSSMGVAKVDGILLDLGVSSFQLDNPERGFSYHTDAPLDMRMDRRGSRTAADLVNTESEAEICRIIRDYGEDRFAGSIARAIVRFREKKKIEGTKELSEIVSGAVPARFRAMQGHPARRTFQALRIALNRELDVLEDSLEDMAELLRDGGRLCVISFHSLEDRIVKTKFRMLESPCTCPPDFPFCVCGKKPKGFVVTKKPILPSEKELEENRRSHSARLRIFQKGSVEKKLDCTVTSDKIQGH